MPTLETLKASQRFKRNLDIPDGSCFGASDPGEFRPSFTLDDEKPPKEPKQKIAEKK